MAEESGTNRRGLDRPAQLVDLDKRKDNPWWRRWFRGGHHYSLEQDGVEVAAVSTRLQRDESFGRGVRTRRTEVRFVDGEQWVVLTQSPGPQRETQLLGVSYRAAWRSGDRVVDVLRRGVHRGRLAHLASEPDTNPVEVTTAGGRSVTVAHARRSVGIVRHASGDALAITKAKGRYLLTPSSPVPLEAVLLHWHVMLGDYHVPQSAH